MRFFAEQFIPTIIFLTAGGYYTIELAGSRIRLVALNMNLYMEDIMDEMKFRRTHLRRRGGVRGAGVLKGEDPSLEAVTDADPMGQWAWLSNVMETATKKRQNVSRPSSEHRAAEENYYIGHRKKNFGLRLAVEAVAAGETS